jgi:hypothetical protein
MSKPSKKVEEPKAEQKIEVVEEPRKAVSLTERDIDLRSKHVLDYHVFAPEGSAVEDLQKPEVWAHIAYKLAPMSQITVTEKSGKWVALLYVVSCAKLSAQTEVIWYKEINANAGLGANDMFEVVWINFQEKYGIKRKADNVLIARDIPTSTAAAQALSNEMNAQRGE